MGVSSLPRGVWAASGFFALSGMGEVGFAFFDPSPLTFDAAWQALGRAVLHWLVAFGLWRRVALCRSVAIVYCLAAIVTYAAAILLAFAQVPVRFPPSVVFQSLYQVPSCLLLLPYLRSSAAAAAFPRPLFGP